MVNVERYNTKVNKVYGLVQDCSNSIANCSNSIANALELL